MPFRKVNGDRQWRSDAGRTKCDAAAARADEALTQTLKQALVLVDVRVLDHVIVAGCTSLSFAERGLM